MLERVRFDNGVVAYVSPLLRAAGVPHAFSTRTGGVSGPPFDSLNLGNPAGGALQDDPQNIAANYRLLQAAIGCADRRRVFTHQVHGADVVDPAHCAVTDSIYDGDELGRADGIVSADARLLLSVRTADCAAVLIASTDGRKVAAVHAGWRGIVAGATAAAMRSFDPHRVLIAIGPHIQRDHFEVSTDVAQQFTPDVVSVPRFGGKPHVDLQCAIVHALLGIGVPRDAIDTTDRCTAAHTGEFFSHRRDRGVTGRMAAVIGAIA